MYPQPRISGATYLVNRIQHVEQPSGAEIGAQRCKSNQIAPHDGDALVKSRYNG